MNTRGYAAQSATSLLAPFSFDRRAVGDRDVQIAIDYCGICHSDIHTARNEWGRTFYPCVPGHEIVGHVVGTGKAVTRFKTGDRVGVGCFVDSCSACLACTTGEENYCRQPGFRMTYNSLEDDGTTPTFGGYSTQVVVTERFVLKVPDNVEAAAAAPLLCAGITTYSPLKAAGVTEGSRVGVMGLGGLGHIAVKLAASMGAEVTVFSRSPGKEQDARTLGAHHFVLTNERDALKPLAGCFDAMLDTISARHDLTHSLTCLRRGGSLILVGASPERLEFSALALIFGGYKIIGSLVGGIAETQEMLDHCGRHGVVSDIELIEPGEINAAYERMMAGDVKFRFVIDCSRF